MLAKATYFASTGSLGSHNMVGGVDVFDDKRFANNHQSGSGLPHLRHLRDHPGHDSSSRCSTTVTFIRWNPIFVGSEGTDFRTYSALPERRLEVEQRH